MKNANPENIRSLVKDSQIEGLPLSASGGRSPPVPHSGRNRPLAGWSEYRARMPRIVHHRQHFFNKKNADNVSPLHFRTLHRLMRCLPGTPNTYSPPNGWTFEGIFHQWHGSIKIQIKGQFIEPWLPVNMHSNRTGTPEGVWYKNLSCRSVICRDKWAAASKTFLFQDIYVTSHYWHTLNE